VKAVIVNQEQRKNSATKRYQNSDYPSGSFEAAINADHLSRLNEPAELRLERNPLAMEGSGAELEEMVPAFMRRDFFRSEEDAIEPVTPGHRLRRNVTAKPPADPPCTESEPEPERSARTLRVESPGPAEEPLRPLRSEPAASQPEGTPPAPQPRPEPAGATYPPTIVTTRTGSPYSIPLLVALALVMGVFVWREQSRPLVAVQQPLSVPQTVPTSAPAPLPEPTPAGVGFRPTYLAVGPAVPRDLTEAAAYPSASPGADPAEGELAEPEENLATTAAETGSDEAEAEERAAILERMSQASSDSPAPAGEPGELFPSEAESAPEAPVREKPASGPRPEPKPVAKVESKPPVTATAADLFPIDEELPIKPSQPNAPPEQPQQPLVPPVAPPPDGYQIDEPNL
jgi:hypothetical protein